MTPNTSKGSIRVISTVCRIFKVVDGESSPDTDEKVALKFIKNHQNEKISELCMKDVKSVDDWVVITEKLSVYYRFRKEYLNDFLEKCFVQNQMVSR